MMVDATIYHLIGKYPRWLRLNGRHVPHAGTAQTRPYPTGRDQRSSYFQPGAF
jgi:hypothetical protein